MDSHDTPEARADVELRLPADGAYASVLRTTAAGLAARLDFTMDDIEELRIAVGEALALVLPEADVGADLTCRFHLGTGTITVEVCTESAADAEPDYDSFAWQVLDTLAAHAAVTSTAGVFAVQFRMSSQVGATGGPGESAGAEL
jgi:serine/threonine-protein kinase RsbW